MVHLFLALGLLACSFMPLLFELLKVDDEKMQESSIDCLTEMLLKGMEATTKVHMIQKMEIVQSCAIWKNGLPGSDADELREKCAKLLATLCTEILDCWKKVENSKQTSSATLSDQVV